MTLRTAYTLANRSIEQNAAADAALTAQINRELDRGLARLRGVLAQNYSGFVDSGQLRMSDRIIATTIGNALQLISPNRRNEWQGRYESLATDAQGFGVEAGVGIALELDGDRVRPTEKYQADESDSVRRLYNHIADFRQQAIAIILSGIELNRGLNDVQQTLAVAVGKTKTKVEAIARTRNHDAWVAGTTAALVLMEKRPKYEVWNVSWSERTCSFCAARDGNVYRRGDAFIPAHARCRCFWLSYHPSWDDPVFRRENHERSLAMLREATPPKSPNYSATSFEKAAGLSKPEPYLRAII